MQNIPTTQTLKDNNLSNLESILNQTAPLNSRAFLRVLSAMEALGQTQLVKLLIERIKQVLALTATKEGLGVIGAPLEVIINPAEATVLEATLPGTSGVIIPARTPFMGDANGIRYFTDSAITVIGGVATLSLTAEDLGAIGNLGIGDTLTIGTQVAGAESTATVTVVTTTGADEEDVEVFRQRVIFALRASPGGSNPTDHKIWAEDVSGVVRAYPYAGNPSGPAYSLPTERTVYVECDTSIEADGIAPESLLDDVREALNIDPDTEKARPVLGLTDDTLYVEAITRTTIHVIISGLTVDASLEAQLKIDIDAALTVYFLLLSPFIIGIDLPSEKNDLITKLTLAKIVQGNLDPAGGSATGVTFNTGGPALDSYELADGEKAKLGNITYA